MANQEQVDRLLKGVDNWNTWRKEHPTDTIDLSNADLSHADLIRVYLNFANLSGTHLSNARLDGAYLNNANLNGAYLNNAYLNDAVLINADLRNAYASGTRLFGADLSGANLSGADLSVSGLQSANLNGANLTSTNLNNAIIGYTLFGDQDLRTVQGLETVLHTGPSPLSINTFYKSQGNIPEKFVRGTGAPNSFLDYIKTLASKPIEYYTCFISYSSKDEAFVKRLYADLQSNGVRCWFAPEDMKIGDKIRPRIDETIRLFDKLLLVLSKDSIASNWVAYEVEKALDKEPHGIPNVLFPIRIDETILTCNTQWAQDIKAFRHISDFSHWKDHDQYQKSFQRLLRDLKAVNKP
jgi:uncharacterized protein YjbI with pentapeptide repeats